MELEIDFVERDNRYRTQDDTAEDPMDIQDDTAEDQMVEISDSKKRTSYSLGKMMTFIKSRTQKMHTTTVDSWQDELDGPLTSTETIQQQPRIIAISKDEFNQIQRELQQKGITTQLAAEQAITQRGRDIGETTGRKNGRSSLSSLAKLVTYPQMRFRRTISSNRSSEEFFGGEYWKKLGSLRARNKAAASEKPIYRRKSEMIVDFLKKVDSSKSDEARSWRKVQDEEMKDDEDFPVMRRSGDLPVRRRRSSELSVRRKRSSSAWMLEESAIRSLWDRISARSLVELYKEV